MTRVCYSVFFFLLFSIYGCSSGNSNAKEGEFFIDSKLKIPTLVVIMNWNDYREENPTLWHNKIFNKSEKSVNRWYYYSSEANVELIPVKENSGEPNDGVVTVEMHKLHPGGYNDTTFRNEEITQAIKDKELDANIDFSLYDVNGDGSISYDELQIIFIVAGGEQAYGDPISKSIWAHAWNYEESYNPKLDGVELMKFTGDLKTSGVYVRFGASHDIDTSNEHKATVGIMAHEMGHSMFDLYDLYDLEGGSGLGAYDIMSNGTWCKTSTDRYYGETPTQMSAFSKIDAKFDVNVTNVSQNTELSIKCSSNSSIKLITSKDNEYFLLECRDSAKIYSDASLSEIDENFTSNKLFALLYHVDEKKSTNYESGVQTELHHYKVALIEKNDFIMMTSSENIEADYDDVYSMGDLIEESKIKLYNGELSGYSIEVIDEDYTNRTMRFKIRK